MEKVGRALYAPGRNTNMEEGEGVKCTRQENEGRGGGEWGGGGGGRLYMHQAGIRGRGGC